MIAAFVLAAPASAAAQGPLGPLPAPNDLLALGQGEGQTPDTVPVQHPAEPPQTATPLGHCGPNSDPQPGIDGRVPKGSNPKGLWCNMALIAHQGTSGGFKTLRYIDTAGHECAFYDTALLFPTNAINLSGPSLGVAVLDMSDPTHPVQTDTLTELPMLSPHESLALNPKRGLLAAVLGNPSTYPGLVSIYDAHADCRHPVLQSTALSRASVTRAASRPTARRSTPPARRTRRSPRSTSRIPRRHTRSGTATSCHTACPSATTATAPTSPTRPAATC